LVEMRRAFGATGSVAVVLMIPVHHGVVGFVALCKPPSYALKTDAWQGRAGSKFIRGGFRVIEEGSVG
jgi:hypothetical protein